MPSDNRRDPRDDRGDSRYQQTRGGNQVMLLDPDQFSDELKNESAALRATLAGVVEVERFMQLTLNVVRQAPDLLECAHFTLIHAVRKAAQDGLLPDGREGAIVSRWDKNLLGKGRGGKRAHWMPMVQGIITKAKRRGSVKSLFCELIFEGEEYKITLGDSPSVTHERSLRLMNETRIVGAYAIAILADGTIEREVMSIAQIEAVRVISDASEYGPWKNHYGEMVRKTVIRRLSKRLPSLSDGDDDLLRVIERVDELYSFNNRRRSEEDTEKRGQVIEGTATEEKGAGRNAPKRGAQQDAPKADPKADAPKAANRNETSQPPPKDDARPGGQDDAGSAGEGDGSGEDGDSGPEETLEELNARMPVRYVQANGDLYPYATIELWRSEMLGRVKRLIDSTSLKALEGMYRANGTAIAAVRDLSAQAADDVEFAICGGLGKPIPAHVKPPAATTTDHSSVFPMPPKQVDSAKKYIVWLGQELGKTFPPDIGAFLESQQPMLETIRNSPNSGKFVKVLDEMIRQAMNPGEAAPEVVDSVAEGVEA